MPRTSLLSRQGVYVLVSVLLSYIILQALTGYMSICSNGTPFATWTKYYYFAAGFSFVTSTIQQAYKLYCCWCQSLFTGRCEKGVYYMAGMTVGVIAGSSSLLTYSIDHGGVCKDVLGVESSAAQWSEWVTCVPLMAYIAVAVEDKVRLSLHDYIVIACLSIAVFSGAVMNFSFENQAVGVFLFVIGCVALVVSYLVVRSIEIGGGSLNSNDNAKKKDADLVTATKKVSLLRLIYIIFPAFPIVYLFAYYEKLDRDQLSVAFVLLSVAAKLLFVGALIEEQISVTEHIRCRRDAESMVNETRRTFLRYVFHEVRIPLNTITMGMAIIEAGGDNKEEWKEALSMMNGATTFINKTLTDVLFVHEIEEGAMEIFKKPFHMENVISDAITAVSGGVMQKQLHLELDVSECDEFKEEVTPLLIGDRLRIQNVLMSFLDNAVKLSSPLSVVKIKMTKKFSDIPFPSSRVHRVLNIISKPNCSVLSSKVLMQTQNENKNETESEKKNEKRSERRSERRSENFNPNREYKSNLTNTKTVPNSTSRKGSVATAGINNSPYFGEIVTGASDIKKSEIGANFSPKLDPLKNPNARHTARKSSVTSQVCHVEVRVVDVGEGISREDLNGLMRPYSQIRPDYSEQGRGTGLWLVLANEIIKLHGGHVIVESTLGVGSTFGFRISFDIATPGQQRTADLLKMVNNTSDRLLHSSQDLESPIDATTPIRKYLVVDDTPSNNKMLSMLLRGRNIPCDIAENGLEALELIQERGNTYDFIFMDYTMPIMNGGDATTAIRKCGFDRLIFGLTGNALNDDVNIFLEAGADCVLAKPLRACHLDSILLHTRVHGFKSSPKTKFQIENFTDKKCTLRFL